MRIAVTCRFQNSYFSGSLPQVAVLLGAVMKRMGHDVVLVYPKDDKPWFIDVEGLKAIVPPTQEWSESLVPAGGWDLVVEATWSFPAEIRPRVGKRVALFHHYPPLFHDMESSVYPHNPTKRDFVGTTELWTWNHFSKDDIHYLEFLSAGKRVHTLPFAALFEALDVYIRETGVPAWMDTAKQVDTKITGDVPKSLAWSARIVESNMSNTSHCLIPLNIVSEIRKQVAPIRFSVHSGDHVASNAFFQSNVAKNLLLPDISGNFVPRIRLPDLQREKSFLVAHQRFRPLKTYLLEALYLGIPMIHNCDMLRSWGYWYPLNQILDGVEAWQRMDADYWARKGFFAEGAVDVRKKALVSRFGSAVLEDPLRCILSASSDLPRMHVQELKDTKDAKETQTLEGHKDKKDVGSAAGRRLAIWFTDMWDQFQPASNFFMSLFEWAGSLHGFEVVLDHEAPNLLIYGPFGDLHAQPPFAKVPKIHYTGENSAPKRENGTFLNLGYRYEPTSDYIRLPLWALEINWFGVDPADVVNPKPVPLSACLQQDPAVLDAKEKFCTFVATNPRCQNRNMAFHVLNEWRGVDAGGRLFCNLPSGPIPAGLGGGGGEMAKVDFYKGYKYAITYENESSPGYTTEKIFHAKVAGCVPIYWGDVFVDRDFDSRGFLNANRVNSAEELRALVEKLEADPAAWRKAAEVPALTAYKRHWCERTMEEIVKTTIQKVLGVQVTFGDDAWNDAETFHVRRNAAAEKKHQQQPTQTPTGKRRIVTAVNGAYAPAARQLVATIRLQPTETEKEICVYVWPDVSAEDRKALAEMSCEVVEMPTGDSMGWTEDDFWNPQHFAWKLWIHQRENSLQPKGTCVLYMDSGIDVVTPLNTLWDTLHREDMCLIEDAENTNRRWCHPTFCKALQLTESELNGSQIWAGCMGFRVGGRWSHIHGQALEIAQLQREVIVGDKWKPYSDTCAGHRHDQSILSVLTQRAGVPRIPIKDVYTHVSRRVAEMEQIPLYVHRGRPVMIVPYTKGIDEAYLINLERRADRLERFKGNEGSKGTYVWTATDGRMLTMTPQLGSLFRDNDFKWKKSVMGCALSHMGLWQKLANDKVASSYLICEDDVRFKAGWLTAWQAAAEHVPADADVIYLGGVLPPNKSVLPSVTEPVNAYFARVAKNNMFGGGPMRRYFHFCNYSYVLTRQGAQKIMKLIMAKGIYTSGDHMIVNNGDQLLNIYFTTPLLSECFQEDDPVYQKSDFNNFARLDTFDSDLWNNNDHFSQAEITMALAEELRKIEVKVVKEPLSEEEHKRLNEEHARKMEMEANKEVEAKKGEERKDVGTRVLTKEEKIRLWNDFLRAVALKKSEDVGKHLERILASWPNTDAVVADMSWFRIFEQLVLTQNPEMVKHRSTLLAYLAKQEEHAQKTVWSSVLKLWPLTAQPVAADNSVPLFDVGHMPDKAPTSVFYLTGNQPQTCMEVTWLTHMFPHGVTWKECSTIGDFFSGPADQIPVVLYQNHPGRSMTASLVTILNIFQQENRQAVILHMSDEFHSDDVSMYGHPAVRHVFRNYWRNGLDRTCVTVLPLGYAKGRDAVGLGPSPTFGNRNLLWSFVGSADREGRIEALEALKTVGPCEYGLKENWGSPALKNGEEYVAMMHKSKFVPCFRGFKALESFRVYEALEHGAIPVYVPGESNGCADEFMEMYGANPMIAVPSWKEAVDVLPKLAANPDLMEEHRQRVQTWWLDLKRQMKAKIAEATRRSPA